jgi:hypothetical protein
VLLYIASGKSGLLSPRLSIDQDMLAALINNLTPEKSGCSAAGVFAARTQAVFIGPTSDLRFVIINGAGPRHHHRPTGAGVMKDVADSTLVAGKPAGPMG